MDEKTEGILALNRARAESYEAGYENGKAAAERAAQADPATTPDAFDHDDCGCEVCKAIIDAIADTVDTDEPEEQAERRRAAEAADDETEPAPDRDAIDVLIDATEGAMHYAFELEDAALAADARAESQERRVGALEYALENALISMYAMRHDPFWFVAPDAARKDAALFALYMEGLNTLGHPLPGLGDDEPGEPT